jgi:hypothetical protein
MSDELLLNPKYWRDRAEAARAMAANLSNDEAQETLHAVARSYDRMVDIAQRRKNEIKRA